MLAIVNSSMPYYLIESSASEQQRSLMARNPAKSSSLSRAAPLMRNRALGKHIRSGFGIKFAALTEPYSGLSPFSHTLVRSR
jgi:hypothetical protein